MGTAVLFPQDCLRISKSRHRNNFTDAFSRSSIATDSTFQPYDSCFWYPDQPSHSFAPYHGVGPLYPFRARNSFALYPLQREVDRRKPKPKRLWDPQEDDAHSLMPVSNARAFTILQRPKDSEAANELVARFLTISDPNNLSTGLSETRLGTRANGTKPCKMAQNLLDRKKRNGLNGKRGFFDSPMGKSNYKLGPPKLQDSVSSMSVVDGAVLKDLKGDQSKPQNVMRGGVVRPRKSCNDALMLPKELTQVPALGIRAEKSLVSVHVSSKAAFINQPSRVNVGGSGPARLRRASTDSQIVEHLGQYRSQMLQMPSSQIHGFTRASSMSLPERWAGPAYSASPSPSSLPLPKFSLPGQKMPSRHASPMPLERQRSNITKPVEVGTASAALGSHHVEGELDVAFATMSLRRMLKLDPS